jgi:inner membrane protein
VNAAAHQLTACAAVGLFLADREQRAGNSTLQPLAGGLAASVFTKLPDLLEPATSPNHRQFFHSLLFASFLGVGLYKLRQWEPQDGADKAWKTLGMIAISGYLIHLALDATTAKSLPCIGKL